MSFFTDFVKGISNSIGKPTVNEKAAIVESRLVDYLTPSIANLQYHTFESDFYRQEILTDRGFTTLLQQSRNQVRNAKNVFDLLAHAATNAKTLLSGIQDKGINALPDTIVVEGITASSATVLKLIASIDMFVEYSSRLMYHLAQHESRVNYSLNNADSKYLKDYKGSYITIFGLLLEKPDQLLNDIMQVEPRLVSSAGPINASREVVRLNFIPLVTPIFRRIGITLVNWEIEREERLRLEKRGIESAIERHRQSQRGTNDARSEQIIENWRKELVLVNKKIASLEN